MASVGLPANEEGQPRVVFLDRDGVLNVDRSLTYLVTQLELIDGVLDGLSWLRDLGFSFVVVTNQSAVGRGLVTLAQMHGFNKALCDLLSVEGIQILDLLFCPHDAAHGVGEYRQNCACHKPKPGMLLQAAERYRLDLSTCYMIGDKMSDIAAGFNAGCRTVLVETGILNDEDRYRHLTPDLRVGDLRAAARAIAGQLALERLAESQEFLAPFDREICGRLIDTRKERL